MFQRVWEPPTRSILFQPELEWLVEMTNTLSMFVTRCGVFSQNSFHQLPVFFEQQKTRVDMRPSTYLNILLINEQWWTRITSPNMDNKNMAASTLVALDQRPIAGTRRTDKFAISKRCCNFGCLGDFFQNSSGGSMTKGSELWILGLSLFSDKLHLWSININYVY